MGDRQKNLDTALKAVYQSVGPAKKNSAVYETAAWGKTDQASFYNQAVKIETDLSPHHLLEELLSIEQSMGRNRAEKWGERIIDLDILFYGDEIIDSEHLNIPHAEITNRRFALVPMNEIASRYVHPQLGKSIGVLLDECSDELSVKKVV